MVSSHKKFTKDLAKGIAGECILMQQLTKYSPNGKWVNHNDRDTDFRSTTLGVIECKTETSPSCKLAQCYYGQILPRHMWICVNYCHPRKNEEYPDKPAAIRRGPWKTLRDGKYWAEKCGNPKLKALYVKQWIEQTCDHMRLEKPYLLEHLLVIMDPAALITILTDSINKTIEIFQHNHDIAYNDKEGEIMKIPPEHGVVELFHGLLCPDLVTDFAKKGTQECRVKMDMQIVFDKLKAMGKPVTFDLATALKSLEN